MTIELTTDSFAAYAITEFRTSDATPLDDESLDSLLSELRDTLDDASMIFLPRDATDAEYDAFADAATLIIDSPEFAAIIDSSILAP